MILKDSLFRIHKNFKTIKNVMIISTLVNDIRSEDHVCLSPLSIKTSRWRIVAAPFAFSVQKFFSKNIFRTAFCAVKFLTFFETTSFYIFCTLTGDNDQYPSLNIWLQPEYFTAENWKTAHWVCKHNKLLR